MNCYTLTEKILLKHCENFEDIKLKKNLKIKIDQTLTQDATGTMAYLQLEALGIKRVKTKRSVSYIDHNTLQAGFMNADDHEYIASVAKKFGIYYSKPGNGICHQLHLERFAVPGQTLIGSDSHTPTAGAVGMLAFGAGGFDVAAAMAGFSYEIASFKIIRINLVGSLQASVSAKDIILYILKKLTVKGGVGKIIEYAGEGIKNLSVYERATITNMGAELGATTSIFPSDERTYEFLKAQAREEDWTLLLPDEKAKYDEEITINLSKLEPMAACPHSPDNVKTIKEIGPIKIDQVCIGSCTNSSITDMMKVAHILRGKKVDENVSLTISPGSRQVLTMMARSGMLSALIDAGARILECSCGPCIGMGQSPKTKGVSIRTFNRNFVGRSGTKDAQVYLVSPEVAAYSAIVGKLQAPPKELFSLGSFKMPEKFVINDNMICPPADEKEAENIVIKKGPNIKPFPVGKKLEENIKVFVSIKLGDNITTDNIMPAGAKILPFRSNIPYISQFCFETEDKNFYIRAKEKGNSIIIAGENYGQGSSREHAALVPLYLGVRAVAAKSFARIHRANLINSGILPLTFVNIKDYNKIEQDDELYFENIRDRLKANETIILKNRTDGLEIELENNFNEKEKQIILTGGILNYIKDNVN